MITVSIIEDNEGISSSLKIILDGTEGFQCPAVFNNAEDALVSLSGLQPDVLILDIGLPGISGIEFLQQMRSKIPNTQVLMFTIFEDDQNVFEALKAGANGYLLKKTPPVQMLEAIAEVMNGGSPMSANIARKVVSFFSGDKPVSEMALLSEREKEVLSLLAKGYLYKEIAQKLSIAPGTVKRHLHSIYEKLHVQNKTEAINKAFPR